jgi:hypothetical protein
MAAAAGQECRFVLHRGLERRLQGQRVPRNRLHRHADVVAESANVHALNALISCLVVRLSLDVLRVRRPQASEEPVPRRFTPIQKVLGTFILSLLQSCDQFEFLRLIDGFVEPFNEQRLQEEPTFRKISTNR